VEKNSKIYVAGHRGLVGSAIVRKLQEAGYTNLITRTSAELDLRRQDQTEQFFLEEKPEYVFLSAAKVGGIVANSTYKAEFIYDNLAIAMNVIHSAYLSGVKKLLNLGSSCIYPKLAPQPLKEEYLLTGPLEPTNDAYAIAKIAAIKLCTFYNEQYGTNFISGMPTNLYGPNDNFNLEKSHVLPALIRKFLLAKALREDNFDFIRSDVQRNMIGFGYDERIITGNKQEVESILSRLGINAEYVKLWGSGSPYREFLHSDDLAESCLFLMQNSDAAHIGELINIGTGKDQTIKEIAELVRHLTGFQGDIKWDTTKPDGTPKKLQDVTRLHNLGWRDKISLEEGIANVINNYLKEL
jgi:GDP-L-fucose synthase